MDIQLTQILFQIINFSVVLGALTFLLYKPVLKIFDERTKRIKEGQKAAEEAIKNRDEIENARKKMESQIKKERIKILNDTQEESKKRAQIIIAKAKQESQEKQKELLESWKKEKTQLLRDAKAEIMDAIIAVSTKVIGESLDPKKQEKMIDKELDLILKNI